MCCVYTRHTIRPYDTILEINLGSKADRSQLNFIFDSICYADPVKRALSGSHVTGLGALTCKRISDLLDPNMCYRPTVVKQFFYRGIVFYWRTFYLYALTVVATYVLCITLCSHSRPCRLSNCFAGRPIRAQPAVRMSA